MALEASGMWIGPGVRIAAGAALATLLGGCRGDTLVAPKLEATCAANPASGVAPLLVTFNLSVAGAEGPFTVGVNYGDGIAGPLPLVPVPIENTPPRAVFQTTPPAGPGDQIVGPAPLAIRFNMCGSSDVDHDVLRWTMDFQGDGTNEVDGTTGGACRRDFTYAAGTYRPRICVTDLGPDREPAHPFQCKTYTVTAS